MAKNRAYYCFCTDRRLDLLRKDALRRREVPKYDNYCRHLSTEEIQEKLAAQIPYCIRFKVGIHLFKLFLKQIISLNCSLKETG